MAFDIDDRTRIAPASAFWQSRGDIACGRDQSGGICQDACLEIAVAWTWYLFLDAIYTVIDMTARHLQFRPCHR